MMTYSIKNTLNELATQKIRSVEALNINSKHFNASLIFTGILLVIYATYALLSYHFQVTIWTTLLGFSALGCGIYRFSRNEEDSSVHKNRNFSAHSK